MIARLAAAVLLLTACAGPAPSAKPVGSTPYDQKWDDWNVRQCQERGGTPIWVQSHGGYICAGWTR